MPITWETVPLWVLFTRNKRTGYPGEELLSVYRDHGVIPKSSRDDNFNKPSDDLSTYQLVEPGDLAINKMKAWQGSVAISQYRGIVSPAYHVYTANHQEEPQYLHYLFRSEEYIAGYLANSKGIRVNQWDLEPQQHSRMPVLIPSRQEQISIAAFLDHETTRIDALIAEQQRLIELLKEKRQAVISHAVTKGLDPTVPMKDSGVEWLGEVPAHWRVAKMGYFSEITKLTGFEYTNLWQTKDDGEIIALRGFNVKERYLDLSNTERISTGLSQALSRSKLSKGDVVFPCTGSLGNAAEVTEDNTFHINQNIAKIRFEKGKIMPPYAVFWLTSSGVRAALEVNNTSAMQPVVLIGDLRNMRIAVPPINEQVSIIKFLEEESQKFRGLLRSCSKAVEILKERRSALISAAVTGKIDVRNWQPNEARTTDEYLQAAEKPASYA
jgi:type I restriction enzyme S subunit